MTKSLIQLFPFVIVLFWMSLYLWSGIWAYRDANVRGKNPVVITLLVLLLSWPISILVWIAVRPDPKRRQFHLDDYRVQ